MNRWLWKYLIRSEKRFTLHINYYCLFIGQNKESEWLYVVLQCLQCLSQLHPVAGMGGQDRWLYLEGVARAGRDNLWPHILLMAAPDTAPALFHAILSLSLQSLSSVKPWPSESFVYLPFVMKTVLYFVANICLWTLDCFGCGESDILSQPPYCLSAATRDKTWLKLRQWRPWDAPTAGSTLKM